jgi:hypothetical protein
MTKKRMQEICKEEAWVNSRRTKISIKQLWTMIRDHDKWKELKTDWRSTKMTTDDYKSVTKHGFT